VDGLRRHLLFGAGALVLMLGRQGLLLVGHGAVPLCRCVCNRTGLWVRGSGLGMRGGPGGVVVRMLRASRMAAIGKPSPLYEGVRRAGAWRRAVTTSSR